MRIRTWWLVFSWFVFVALSVLTLLSYFNAVNFGDSEKWIKIMMFVIPSIMVLYGGYSTMKVFSASNPEKKTWLFFTFAGIALTIGEILRGLIYFKPDVFTGFMTKLPYIFIFLCFVFLIWGFWYQQSIIETTIGKNVRTLLAVILAAFTVVLIFIAIFGLFEFEMDAATRIFMISFLVGDVFMFSGAMAVIARMWGGSLIKSWVVWGFGTVVIIAYHLISTRLVLMGNVLLDTYAGVILSLGLLILLTAAEIRRAMLI